ncbi:receptor-type tyrosine-protein phosphatase S-like isoform X10 [Xiphophorus maculatus]|uniref:receptor-type tyrosine-protein phosphatase S-like isoform X10 n=1 Tax=Xiphophorus maculatus TaxID=8083 RepID=UPI000C6E8030|nr:receptor-type tyrosine-protein phosphatase S-like isoform X10 [Xiphophorus maculatus]
MATSGAPRLSLPLLLHVTTLLLSLLLTCSQASSKPEFTKVPVDQIGVSGGVVSFVCQATGDPKPKVSWNKKGKKVNSQRIETIEFDEGAGAVLRIQPLRAPRDENIYECLAENSAGENSVSAKLTIIREDLLPPGFPNIDMGPQLKVVERTRTATMLCSASGKPDPEITWYKDFLPIDPNTSDGRIKQLRSERFEGTPIRGALQIENSEELDQGKYECVASNEEGVRYSSPANLYVRELREVRRVPPRFSILPESKEIMPGGSVNITCVAVGSPMPYVKWMLNAEDLTPDDEMPVGRNVLELSSVRESANYTCVAMSSLGIIEAVAQITVKSLPKPPGTPVVTETTATSVTITWDSGNPDPVTYYIIQYRARSPDSKYETVDSITTTRYSIGGLYPNTEYEIRVSAVNSIGQGPPSEPVETRTGEQAPASPPRNIKAQILPQNTMMVQWEEPEEPNGQIKGYRVYYTMDDSQPMSLWQIHNVQDSLITTIQSLVPQGTYTIKVLAFTSVGDGPFSAPIQVKVLQGVPGQPSKFQVGAVSDTSIELTWEPAYEKEGIINYELRYKEGDSDTQMTKTFGPTKSYVVESLRPNTKYRFSLAAISNKGIGAFTNEISERTLQAKPSAPPQEIKCSTTSSTSLLVSWRPPPLKSQNGDLTGYRVRYQAVGPSEGASDDTDPMEELPVPATEERVLLQRLEKWTQYQITVSASTEIGPGPESEPLICRTDEDVPGAAPRRVEVEVLNSTALKVMWRSVTPGKQNGQIRGYQVHYVRVENGESRGLPLIKDVMLADAQWETDDTAEYEMVIGGLKPDTTYSVTVAAYTTKGDGARSKPKVVVTKGADVPKNFTVKWATKTTIVLGWKFSDRGSPYKCMIEYNGQKMDVDARKLKAYITGLRHSVTYKFGVKCQEGLEGEPRHRVTASTAPFILIKKPKLDIYAEAENKLTMSFPSFNSGDVKNFYVVVVPLKRTSGTVKNLKNPDEMDIEELLRDVISKRRSRRQLAQLDQRSAYITACFKKLPSTFTVGYDHPLSSCENKPLEPGQEYVFFLLAELNSTLGKMFATSQFTDTVMTPELVVDPLPVETGDGLIWVVGPVLAVVFIIGIVISILLLKNKPDSRKRKESEPRTKCLLNNADITPHHPTDPVEMRRINFQTPDSGLSSPQSEADFDYESMMNHPPIPISELAEHTELLKANDNLKLSQEYESIDPGQQFTWEHSNLEVNKPKNRYANVIAYDHSRVILAPIEGITGSDYINANYIDGYRKQNAYIATQGPLPETFGDFWRMVWEQRTATVVMMTRLEEKSRIKCDQYWPSRGTETYGMTQVTLLDTIELATFCVRTFSLHKNGSSEKREVRQFQFTAWPDHGVPEYPTPFLAFLRRVKTCNPPDAGPIIAHCSAGVGRTGCFIVIDAMLERIKHEKTVDIYGHVTLMRSQRNYMVQTEDQYSFIHDALLEAVACGNTEVAARSLYSYIQKLAQVESGEHVTGMELEFKRLANSKAHTSRFISANLPCNKFKNRLVNIMPYETTRVCLQPIRGLEGSDYINASFIDGYRQQRAYIATQGPLAETTEDFWRMLWENNSTIVVMLTKLREMGREKCHQYWPAERSARYQYFVVDPMAEYNMPQYILREFKVTDARDGQSRTVRQFQFTDWPEQGVPKSGEGFIDFIGQVHKTKEQFGQDGPISVHCSAGVGRTGVFITLSIVLERMRYEGVVDIFQTVKMLRTQRPAMVQTEDEYQFCYHAALEYLGSFDHYAT